MTSGIEESMTSGRSVSSWTSVIALTMSAASSASGAPMLTSSSIAPPATCCCTSMVIRDRSPSRSCCWNTGRPVGLIRSPMIANGWSWPTVTVFVALESVVCMVLDPLRVRERAAAAQQFLRLDHRGGGVRRVPVGADHVGVLLGDRRPAHHYDDLVSQAGLGQRVDVRLEHRHRRGEEGGEAHDVRLVLLYRVDELLRRDLAAEVDHQEPGALEHDVHP